MHILLIHQAFAALDEPGGTRHFEFARFLADHGHQVTVVASPVSYLTGSNSAAQPGKPEVIEGANGGKVTILRAYTYKALHKSFVHRFLAFVSFMISSLFVALDVRSKVDVVWGTSPPIFQGISAWLVARVKGAKFLFEVRDLWPDFAIAVGVLKNPLLIRMSYWLEDFLYTHADRMMVNSPAYVTHVQERGAKRVSLIPNGADPAMFNPADKGDAFRMAHGLGEKFVVMYAGAHGMSNDLDVVLDAAALVRDNPNIQVVLVGDGKEKPRLQTRAMELGLTNVLFVPPVPKTQMAGMLAAADACVAILKPIEAYKTTYPNKVFDYMAAGRAVLLVIDGVIRDVVETAGCGTFVQPGSAQALAAAIRSMEGNRNHAMRMGLNGRRHLKEHFSRQAIAEKLLILLQSI